MKWVLNMFIIVFFAIAIMIIVMTMLCATRSPQLFLEKRPEDEC
jgi:lipopolysaccharide/colanic/teichoic acid biosynthesis glycosyltransferase